MTFLVDTNVISERQRPRPNRATQDWTLVTRNVVGVRRTGVGLLNPFSG